MPEAPDRPWLQVHGDALRLDVLVSPRSSRTRVMGVHDDRLKIQLAAPPVDGKANEVLIRFLADALDVSRAQIQLVSGATSRRKTVRLAGVTLKKALLALAPSIR